MKGKKWTIEDIEKLRNNYNILPKEDLLKMFPNRNWSALNKKAQMLGFANRLKNYELQQKHKVKPNEIIICENHAIILVKNGRNSNDFFEVKIDLEDVKKCQEYKWCYKKDKNKVYFRTTITYDFKKYKEILLHRFINNPKNNEVVDHINGDTLDNRKINLRNTTHLVNSINKKSKHNKTGVECVSIYKNPSGYLKYILTIRHNGYIYFYNCYPYTDNGLKQAKEDKVIAKNYIYRNTDYFDNNIETPDWIKEIVNKFELRHKNKEEKLYGKRAFRKKILERDNYFCCGCSKSFIDNPKELEVHHIEK